VGPGAVGALGATVEGRAAGVPPLDVEPERPLRGEQMAADLGVVTKPRVAVAAGGGVEGVELGAGDPRARRRSQQGERAEIRHHRAVARVARRRRHGGFGRRLGERGRRVVVRGQRPDAVERPRTVGRRPVGQQRRDGRPADARIGAVRPAQRCHDHHVAAEGSVLVAVAGRRRRQVLGRVAEDRLEGDRPSPDDLLDTGRAREVIVFPPVERLDGVAVAEATDSRFPVLGRERDRDHERGVVSPPDGDVSAVPVAERPVVLLDDQPPAVEAVVLAVEAVVLAAEHRSNRRIADVRLLARGQFVEPDHVAVPSEA